MLTELVLDANVSNWLSDLGRKIENRLFRPSGWRIPDDTDTGISFGEAIDAGGGYMEMDVLHMASRAKYEIRGGYGEVGMGIGEISKLQGLVNRIVKVMPKGARPSSDLVVLPGGSITQFIMGPTQDKPALVSNDFKYSSWIYVHIGGELAIAAGDVGLMFMVDHNVSVNFLMNAATMNASGMLGNLLMDCLAWAPYYGVSVGLGAGGKVAVRIIQTVQMNPA